MRTRAPGHPEMAEVTDLVDQARRYAILESATS